MCLRFNFRRRASFNSGVLPGQNPNFCLARQGSKSLVVDRFR